MKPRRCRFSPRGLAPFVLSLLLAATGSANLLRNGSFETTAGRPPADWHSPQGAGVALVFEASDGRASNRSAHVRIDTYQRIDRTSRASLEQRNLSGIVGERWYRLSGWLRTENLESALVRAILVDDHAGANGGLYLELVANRDWQRFEKTFKATVGANADPRLEFFIEETGGVWFDDLELVEVPEPHPVFTDLIPAGSSVNLVPNASFEGSTDNWSSLGKSVAWAGGLSSLFGELDSSQAFEGRYSLRIALDRSKLPASHFDVWPAARTVQDAPLAANLGWLPVQRGAAVTLSAYLRADRPGVPAVLSLHFSTPDGGTIRKEERVALTTDWKRYSFTCPAEAASVFVAIGPDLGGTRIDNAVVWLDAVQLETGARATTFVSRDTFAARLTSDRFGHVFAGPTRPHLQLTLENHGASRELNLHLRSSDYFGREIAVERIKVTAPDDRILLRDVPLSLPGKGHYTLTLHESDDPSAPNLLLRPLVLAWVDGYTDQDSPFGINHVPNTAELSEQLRLAGVTWGRDWSLNWEHLEPTPGALDFTSADIQIDRTIREKLNPLALLPPFPSANWASSIPAQALVDGPDWSKLWLEMAYAPANPTHLDNFIRKAAEHFKLRVSVWEFLNEPFYTLHALPALNQIDESMKQLAGADYRVEDYIDLLKRAYRITKEVNPASRMIGGISGRPDLMSREFIAAGGLDHLDIFNLHIYPGLRRPEYYIGEMERLLALMDRGGGRKPMWVTEYGYYGLDETLWHPHVLSAWDWPGNRLLHDERQAADYSIRFAAIMLAHGVEKIFYHSGMGVSSNVNSHASNESGLTRYGGVPRKLYAAQAAMSRFLGPRPVFAEAMKFHPATPDAYGYVFDTARQPVAILWSAGAPMNIELAPNVTAHDAVGNPLPGRRLTLGPSPCYLTGAGLDAQQLARAWQAR